jgi:hypothetical protein
VDFAKRSFNIAEYVAQNEIDLISRKIKQQEIVMTQDNNKEGSSVLYWIMLATMFGAFITVALS